MTALEFDQRALRRPGLLLVVVTAVVAVLLWFSSQFRDTRQRDLGQARTALSVIRDEHRLAVEAGDVLRSSRERYLRLQQRGFVGAEARLLWIESLRSAGQRRQLYKLKYRLSPQRAMNLSGFENSEHYQLYSSRMQVQLELAHEIDLLRFFDELDREQPAVYELRGCTLAPVFADNAIAIDGANVSASCELAWYTVRPFSAQQDGEGML